MTTPPGRPGDMVVVADAHLGPRDPDLRPFCEFLAAREADAAVVVLLGDIFSLWLGAEKFTSPHHREVLEACAALRRGGVRVVLVEGNREYMAREWRGKAFDTVASRFTAADWAGRRWCLAHGDLFNPGDWRGRAFRALVRFPLLQAAVRSLPAPRARRLAEGLRERLAHRNLGAKTALPPERFARYARWLARRGFHGGILGHLHVELSLHLETPGGPSRHLICLPDWRSGRRFLRLPGGGEPRFATFGPPRPEHPVVLEAVPRGNIISITVDRPARVRAGQVVAFGSGHGPEVRGGRVVRGGPGERRLEVDLDPGPPVLAGDRLIAEEEAL